MNRRRHGTRFAIDGQGMVEFALILPLLLILLVGVLDFGRAIYAYNGVANAARSATRVAIVNQTVADIEAAAATEAVGLDPLTVSIDYSDGVNPCGTVERGCIVNVEVAHAWMPATPILNAIIGPISLDSSASMPVERVWPSPSP